MLYPLDGAPRILPIEWRSKISVLACHNKKTLPVWCKKGRRVKKYMIAQHPWCMTGIQLPPKRRFTAVAQVKYADATEKWNSEWDEYP